MKIKIDKDVLAHALSQVVGVCNSRTMPILESCLMTAGHDGRVTISATDLEVTISTEVQGDVSHRGSLAVPAKRLYETLRSSRPGEVTLESQPNHYLQVRSGRSRANLVASHPDEYPNLPTLDDDDSSFDIASNQLAWLIERVLAPIDSHQDRDVFLGARLTIEDGKLQMTATDGHRFHLVSGEAPEGAEFLGGVIQKKALLEIKRLLRDEDTATVSTVDNDIVVSVGKTILRSRLILGRYPAFQKVIPSSFECTAIVDLSEVRRVLKRVSGYSNKMNSVRMHACAEGLKFYGFNALTGELEDIVDCEFEGKDQGVTVGVNYRYLGDVLNLIESSSVRFEIIDTESPMIVSDIDNHNATYIVMPVQI